jgi:hypothetical protein
MNQDQFQADENLDINIDVDQDTDIEAKEPESFDLDDILSESTKQITFDVAVISDSEGNPVSGFRIVGRNSDKGRAAERAVRITNQKAAALRNKAIDPKTDAGAAKIVGMFDAQNVARAAAVVVDWFGWTKKDADGKPVERPFDAALVPMILKQKPTWVEKITFAMNEDNNFLPKSQSNSAPTQDNS